MKAKQRSGKLSGRASGTTMNESRDTAVGGRDPLRFLRWQRYLYVFASGGVTLGLINAWTTVDFGQIITSFLSRLFSILVSLLLGGQINTGT